MTRPERVSIAYLLIISTSSVILNLIILNKKAPQPPKSAPVQTQTEPTTKTAVTIETAAASDSASLVKELTAIRNELSQIRAIQRGQSQTLGTADTDTDIEDFLGDINVPTPPATPTAKLTPAMGFITLRSISSADIHQEKSSSSIVIGSIYFGKNYPYSQKQGNWYLIKTQSVQGWVNASLVKETE